MLTVVGGYYVSILSLGDKPLGAKPIPLERVRMPYNLMRTLADATKLTTKLIRNRSRTHGINSRKDLMATTCKGCPP